MKRWYQVGDERKRLSSVEVHQPENAGAILITCPECISELENGRAVPAGVVHECDEGMDLTFRLPSDSDPEPVDLEFSVKKEA